MAGKKDLERLRRRKRRKQNIIRATVHFFVWAGVAVLYYIGFSLFFDTPVEYELKHSTDRLRREYAALTQRYDSLTTVMHNLSERDRNVFRILFESDPYDFDSEYERRQAVTYENIFNRSSRRLKLELRERVADMEKRLDELNASYLDLQALIDSAGSGCNNIPAIQPVINKQLTLLTASYGMRIHPFYKTLQSHQGVDYTIPRVARLRHGRRRGARRGAAQLHVGADGRDRPRQRLRDFVQPPLEDQRTQGTAREPRRDHRPFGRHGPFALAPPPLRSAAERHARRPDPLLLHGTHPHRIPAPDAHRTVGHAVVRLKTKEMGNDWTKDFGFAREEIFRSEETLRTIRHIRASWGGEPEFLWEKFPDYAVFRRQDNAKWYAVILTVQAGKLGLADEGRTEILDIRADAETMARALDFEHYFPGYHMNKRTWLTVRLDGSVPFGEIAPLIARSYELAGKK